MDALAALKGRRVLVTGARGFIGSHIVERAVRAGAQTYAMVRGPLNRTDVQTVNADVADALAVSEALAQLKPEIVVHAAAMTNWAHDSGLFRAALEVNTLGAAVVLEASRQAKVKRVVLLGSAGEYGCGQTVESGRAKPIDPYSVSKLAATELALTYHRAFQLSCTIMRPFQVYGPGEQPTRILSATLRAAARGEASLDITAGEQLRDFVYVDDVAEAIWRAGLCPSAAGAVINVATGVANSVRDAVSLAVRVSGQPLATRFGALPYRAGELMQLVGSVQLSRELLGWSPATSLAEGLGRYWQYVRTEAPLKS